MHAFRAICFGLAGVSLLVGCATPIPLAQEAPDLSYRSTQLIAVGVLDERDVLREGKPPTYIGRAHGMFGVPMDMQVYPWFVTDKEKKGQPLAKAIEDRIVFGLNDKGWRLTASDLRKSPSKEDAAALLAALNSQRLLVLTISQWFVSLNLNLVTAFNFDWGYKLDVFDAEGATVVSIGDAGRDVVDVKGNDSYSNQIKLAYRQRLIKILERPETKAALQE